MRARNPVRTAVALAVAASLVAAAGVARASELEDRVTRIETLTHHANYLRENPTATITLEGHGDERGSREYNIGLGERRAQAVRQIMELSGVGANQLTTVSYGEEKPAVDGHDESAWSQNRRVELVYPGR